MQYSLLLSLIVIIGGTDIPVDFNEFIVGNKLFTGRIYSEFVKNGQNSFVLSPYSIQTIFALTQHGTRGLTKEEILAGVNLPKSPDLIKEIYLHLYENRLTTSDDYNLTTINKIYVENGYKIDKNFIDLADQFYQSSIENIDFQPNDLATNKINKWVEEQTNYRINNLLNPDSLNRDTVLILINCLYFQGRWLNRFNKQSTKLRKFHKTINESLEIETIQTIDSFNYYESSELDAKFVELPYLLVNASMIIVLPNQIDDLQQLERSIDRILDENPAENWSQERVNLTIPKFKIDTRIELVDILKSLGVRKIFSEDADFSGLATGDGCLAIGKVLHKTFINVDEEGTEGVSATAVIGQDRIGISDDPTFIFNADHPFLFYIKINEIVYFIGRYLV